MSAYPDSEDYVRAVQRPDLAFRRPELRSAVFELHPLYGIAIPASGNAAIVFRARVRDVDQALRFFIRKDASSREHYDAIGLHLTSHGLADCAAGTVWVDDAIEVSGKTWPMVQMEWIDGRTLDAYVGYLAERCDVAALHVLAESWRERVRRLQAAEFAHGDLQHGNVLIDRASALRLVDFDGSWIAAFQGERPPDETGHPNYQRTGRAWGRWMDTFPALVIYTGLLALSRRPDAWRALHNGENMLFSQDDFSPPFNTPAWRLLAEIPDADVAYVVERLRDCCHPEWRADASLEELLARARVEVSPGPGTGPRPIEDDPDVPWWIKTAPPGTAAAGGTATPGAGMPPPPGRSAPPPSPSHTFHGANPTSSWYGQQTGPDGTTGGPVGGTGPQWPQPPTPAGTPEPDGRPVGRAAAIATVVAFVAALLVAIVVGASDGEPGAPAVLAAVLAFIVTMLVVSFRRS